ncbi:MAG: hypothetical protein HQL52_11810 [Magnetococcales bacterium]|nr:hypothetical protein [Magnetococcales bacterium]
MGAIVKKAEALKDSTNMVDYVRAQNWDGALPQTMMGGDQSVLWKMGAGGK